MSSEYPDLEYTVSARRNSSTCLPFVELTCTEVLRTKLRSPTGETTSSPSLPDKTIAVRHPSCIPLGKPVAYEIGRGPKRTTACSKSRSVAKNYSPDCAETICRALRRFGITRYGCFTVLLAIDTAIESSSEGEGEIIDVEIFKIITEVYTTDYLKTEEYVLSDESDGCVICLEDFKQGELVAELPCDHHFHEACILRWMKISDECPLCRFLFLRR